MPQTLAHVSLHVTGPVTSDFLSWIYRRLSPIATGRRAVAAAAVMGGVASDCGCASVGPNPLQPTLEDLDELLMLQKRSVERALLQPGARPLLRLSGDGGQGIPVRIICRDQRSVLAPARAHPRPERLDQGEALDRPAGRNRVTQDGQKETGMAG